MQSTFWINDPAILFNSSSVGQIWPNKDMNMDEKFNSITRLIIALTILGYLINSNYKVIVAGVMTILSIVILNYTKQMNGLPRGIGLYQEGFSTLRRETNEIKKQQPTIKNPMMNVLLPQIQDNPTRPTAEDAFKPSVVDDINKKTQEMIVNNFDNTDSIQEKLFSDLGDNFEFDRSMISFNSTANTTIPNDQKSFAEFCYGGMISCKEGNSQACVRSAPQHWVDN